MHYRGILILITDFNMAFGRLVVPFIKLMLAIAFVVCLFAVIRLTQDLETLSLTLLVMLVVASAVSLFPISVIMSSLFDTSTQLRSNLIPIINETENTKARTYFDRQLLACEPVRCQVGSLYHMEANAKLTLMHNIVSAVVCLLVNVRT